ncbi:MAG: hypothetical protein AAF492_14585, partial [Verrucomicrobiota bacterium]
ANGGSPGTVLSSPDPIIAANPPGFTFSLFEGESISNQNLAVWNSGLSNLNYTLTDDAPWLSISPSSGSSTGGADVVNHTLTFSGLGVGSFTGTVTITDANAVNSPRTLPISVTVTPNLPPSISSITFDTIPVIANQSVGLNATVLDDLFPGRPLSISWNVLSGPHGSSVGFAPSDMVADPDLTFDWPGLYQIQLIADDTQYQAVSNLVVTVEGVISQSIDIPVNQSSDDAEEHQNGAMEDLTSSDLELVRESDNQVVGIRFRNLLIPAGAIVTNAWIQFGAKDTDTEATDLQIFGELSTNAVTFANLNSNITTRPMTATMVAWSSIPAWTAGEKGPTQRTPNIAAVVQEIVNQPGWTENSPIVITFQGTGQRNAWSYDGNISDAPLLHVDFLVGIVPVDGDGDGMDDNWEILHFGSTNALPNVDADGEGVSNLDEFIADTNPNDPTSFLAITRIVREPGGANIQWQGGTWATQILERNTDLYQPTWSSIYTSPPPTLIHGNYSDSYSITNNRVYYRIRAIR